MHDDILKLKENAEIIKGYVMSLENQVAVIKKLKEDIENLINKIDAYHIAFPSVRESFGNRILNYADVQNSEQVIKVLKTYLALFSLINFATIKEEGIKEILNGQEQSLKIYLEDQEITNEKIAILSYIVSVLNKTLNDLKGPIL